MAIQARWPLVRSKVHLLTSFTGEADSDPLESDVSGMVGSPDSSGLETE